MYSKPDSDNSMEPTVVSEEEREPDILLDEVKDAILLLKIIMHQGKTRFRQN